MIQKEKCKIGDTHFISPPRPCATNLWVDKDVDRKGNKYPSWILESNLNWN